MTTNYHLIKNWDSYTVTAHASPCSLFRVVFTFDLVDETNAITPLPDGLVH